LKVGTQKGGSNIHNTPWLSSFITSRYVIGLPTNGKKVYVRLQLKADDENGDVHYKDYWYKAHDLKAACKRTRLIRVH
jgi:hypothetical protein